MSIIEKDQKFLDEHFDDLNAKLGVLHSNYDEKRSLFKTNKPEKRLVGDLTNKHHNLLNEIFVKKSPKILEGGNKNQKPKTKNQKPKTKNQKKSRKTRRRR